MYFDGISKNTISYLISDLFFFAHDVSNNSISYSHGTVCMIITRKVFWKRGWQRRYQLHVQYFFRNYFEIVYRWRLLPDTSLISLTILVDNMIDKHLMKLKKTIRYIEFYLSYRVYLYMVILKETTVGIN